MLYPSDAVERAMKVHEVIMRALDGQLTWIQAAEILGRSPRSIRRLRGKARDTAIPRSALAGASAKGAVLRNGAVEHRASADRGSRCSPRPLSAIVRRQC
jgi:hypothetical protein